MAGKKGASGGRRAGAGRRSKADLTSPLSLALREIRMSAGLSGSELGRRLSSSDMRISRVETGMVIPDKDLTAEWLSACGATKRLQEMMELRQDRLFATKVRWDDAIDVVAAQEEVGNLVASADLILSYCDFCVPGLLQTPDYTASLFRLDGELDTRALEKSIAVRQKWRRAALANARSLSFVLSETALSRPYGAAQTHQLESLDGDSRLPNVTIRVLPGNVPTRVIPKHSFTVFGKKLVMIELFTQTLLFRDKAVVESYHEVFQLLAKDAIAYRQMGELVGHKGALVNSR